VLCRFFSFFAHRTEVNVLDIVQLEDVVNIHPQALHNVFGPFGPFRHSGESSVPQSVQTYSSATLSFFFCRRLLDFPYR
jgi:hypothetical protein